MVLCSWNKEGVQEYFSSGGEQQQNRGKAEMVGNIIHNIAFICCEYILWTGLKTGQHRVTISKDRLEGKHAGINQER